MVGSLGERDFQQGRKTTAGAHFCAGPGSIIGPSLALGDLIHTPVHVPDHVFLLGAGQVQEEAPVKPLRSGNLRRQLADVVGRAHKKTSEVWSLNQVSTVPNMRVETPLSP